MHPFRLILSRLLLGAAATLPFTAAGALPAAPLASGHVKFLGSVYSAPQATNMAAYFNQVTPENAGKWGSVEGTRDVMNWTELDAAYATAKANHIPFRFHVLVWGNQQPTWIATLPPAEQLEEIEEWFQAVAARYPALDYLEVVNEPINDPPDGQDDNPANVPADGNYMNALGGSGATGWDWVLTAFRMAKRIFPPTTQLMLNEYSITNDTTRMNRYIGIVNLLKAENLIDAVGVQAHYFSTRSYSGNLPATSAQTKANLDLLAATGVPIMVTEMDIDGGASTAALDDALQLSEYQRIFPIFWQHPSVIGITLWGYRPGMWRQTAYTVNSDDTERPAMTWLREYLTTGAPAITTQPVSQTVALGGSTTLTMAATGTPAPTLSWKRNGSAVAGATETTLPLGNVQPADTGIYTGVALGGTAGTAAAVSTPAIIGLSTEAQVAGSGEQVGNHVQHPNGNFYDQVLLTGVAEAIKADPENGEITRTSFIDADGDIVQVEFGGPGTLSLVLANAGERAAPENYNQSNVLYMKGHAGIVITGATEETNVTVFTVGRATAYDPTGAYNILLAPNATTNNPANNGSPLFVGHANTTYDGIADLAFIAISSANGRFGGIRAANANFYAATGFTGIYAPGVEFTGPVFFGDIMAYDQAKPVLLLGSAGDVRVTGGTMEQINAQPVQVSGVAQLQFKPGSDSHGNALPAQTNRGTYWQDGVDVTSQIVVNPSN